ncbi:MAG: beta-ketoacyl synthase [Proteobacteria bacterium]|nr:beta-ketoacyl synthase [Pseudomonadota bacterium]MBU1739147.1 beta-ketoacyl synthase [Pseudomonadota bacterium]
MKEVVIVAAAVETALGNLEATWQGLMRKKSALEKDRLPGALAGWPVGLVPGLDGAPGSSLRLKNLVRKLVAGLPEIPERAGLVASTTKGAPDELFAKNIDWPGQPWEVAADITKIAGITGKRSTVSGACASGTIAVIQAVQRLLAPGGEKVCLVVGLDLVSTFVTSGFAKLHALSPERSRPFDRNRNGLSLGEGGGALLLATVEEASARSWPVLARAGGWGVSCDAGHITAPCREASGLIRVIEKALRGGLVPGGINAHGTGTTYNDAMEMRAFSDLWSGTIPFHSVKGAIGHTLGAAGVIEAAIAVRSLEAGVLPPTVGLEESEDGMNVSGEDALPLTGPSVLSTNSGFGGINAALLLQQ